MILFHILSLCSLIYLIPFLLLVGLILCFDSETSQEKAATTQDANTSTASIIHLKVLSPSF